VPPGYSRVSDASETSVSPHALTETSKRDPSKVQEISARKNKGRMYLPQLDALRFFAFLSVFFYHGLPSNDVGSHTGYARLIALFESTARRSGGYGVGVFFLLSAFLITELLKREKQNSGWIDLKKFYLRRTLRIWPLYFLAIMLGLLAQGLSPTYHLSARDILTYIFFVKNWDVALHGFNWNPIYVLWTISVEEQFYLVWPLLQRWFNRRAMTRFCLASIVILPAIAFWPPHSAVRESLFYFTFFPLGGILSFALKRREPVNSGRCMALLAFGAGMWFTGTLLQYPGGDREGPLGWRVMGLAVTVAGSVLIFLAFLRSNPKWWPGPVTYLGKISYGLYVFQIMAILPATQLTERMGLLAGATHSFKELAFGLGVRLPLALGIAIAMAAISYRYFETPFLNLKERFEVIRSRSV
jgi:peptidoglycan/LPS O-acetylase OafA/YrhL